MAGRRSTKNERGSCDGLARVPVVHAFGIDNHERRWVTLCLFLLGIGGAWVIHAAVTKAGADYWWIDYPSVLGVFAILYGLFDRWLWRVGALRSLKIVATPDLRGSWDGEVVPANGPSAGAVIPATLVIRQTWTRICIQ